MKSSYIKYFTALLLFGTNGIIAGGIALGSCEIVLLRTLLGSVFLAAVFFITGHKPQALKFKKDFLFICISGVAMGASWMFLYEAYVQVGVSIATLLYYCGPVMVMALSPLLFGERLTVRMSAGFGAVLAGVVFINGNTGGEDANIWGITCALLSAVTYTVMVITNKKAGHISGIENSLIQLAAALVTVTVFVAFKSGLALPVQLSDIPPILLLGLVNTGVGCYFYFSSLGKLPVQTVAVCGYLEPLSAVIFSALLLHEKMTPAEIIGGALILGGAAFGAWKPKKAAEQKI